MRHAIRSMAILAALSLSMPEIGHALEANEVFKRTDPSVVVIVANGAKRTDDSFGSGIIVEALDIVTSCHVLNNAVRITVKQGSVQRSAKLRYQDAARDLCQIRLDDAFPSGKPVTSYVLSKDLEVGQQVFAIGSPRGLEHTISRGIVSALREMKEESGSLIQTDAAVSPGSSGGGLFDAEGRLVGIITFQFKEGQNLNFAIPADWVQELAKRNRDRLADIPQNQSAQGGKSTAEATATGMPRIGDRWKYRLFNGKRAVGTVVVEITDTRGKIVTERITREDEKGFLAERNVTAEFNPVKFQEVVTLPGGFQLTEIAPYAPPGQDIRPGQKWPALPVTLMLTWYGKKKFLTEATVVGQEKIKVPAGTFDTIRVEAKALENFGSSIVKVNCNYWYSVEAMRSVKMSVEINYSVGVMNSSAETYELISFEPAK